MKWRDKKNRGREYFKGEREERRSREGREKILRKGRKVNRDDYFSVRSTSRLRNENKKSLTLLSDLYFSSPNWGVSLFPQLLNSKVSVLPSRPSFVTGSFWVKEEVRKLLGVGGHERGSEVWDSWGDNNWLKTSRPVKAWGIKYLAVKIYKFRKFLSTITDQ